MKLRELSIPLSEAWLEPRHDLIDNENGLGTTGYNRNIDYKGIRLKIKPSKFLKLTTPPNFDFLDQNIRYIKNHLRNGGKIASPHLIIKIPVYWEDDNYETTQLAKVSGHEGRHRAVSVKELYGDIPIEVHIIFASRTVGGPLYRNKHIKPVWKSSIKNSLISEFTDEIVEQPFS